MADTGYGPPLGEATWSYFIGVLLARAKAKEPTPVATTRDRTT